jgi:hypothetical protein
MVRFFGRFLCLAALVLLPGYSQQFGEITGTTTDASGAVVVGAVVTATNTGTQAVRTTASNDTGNYALPNLLPGTYNLRVEKAGFKVTARTGVEVQVGDVVRADFALQVGEVSQQVEVTGAAEQLNTESTSMGSVVATQQIVDLPLNGRDYIQLVSMNTSATDGQGGATGGSSLEGGTRAGTMPSIAGQRLEYNHYTLDGVQNTDPNFGSYIIHPSVDALQEFKVQTGIYSAEFGRGASQINANTLPGSNAYHGAAFEFLRNDWFDAKPWNVSGNKTPYRRNDYGFTLDGPVRIPHIFNGKNRLFFMSNFENLGDTTVNTEKVSVAPDAFRQGDFNFPNLLQSGGNLIQIYDPATRVYPVNGTPSAIPFPNNTIPASRINPAAAVLQSYQYMPEQSVPGYTGSLSNNYIGTSLSHIQSTQFNQRIDFNENPNSTWFGRFSWANDFDLSGGNFQNNSVDVPTVVRQSVIANTRILSPSIVNDARFNWNQFNNFYTGYYSYKTDVQATLGIQGLVAPDPSAYALPALTIPFSYAGGQTPWVTHNDTFQWMDGVSILRGKHSIKIGGEFNRLRYNQFGNQKTGGEFDFDGGSTCNPANCTASSGYEYADFLLGLPQQVYRVLAEANAQMRSNFAAGYVQDDWKVNRKLTLNLGLRYENQRPWAAKNNSLTDPQIFSWGVGPEGNGLLPNDAATTPIMTRAGNQPYYNGLNFQFGTGILTQNGNQLGGPSMVYPDNRNWGPRLGLAYAPTDKWSIRAGYGIYYVQDIGNGLFDIARNIAGRDGTVLPNNERTNSLSAPWANEQGNPSCPGYSGVCLIAPQVLAYNSTNRSQYVEQDMFVVQRQLTHNLVLESGYLGNQGHHLQRMMYLNQAIYQTPGVVSSIASRRPWPGYGVIQDEMNVANSNYNSLESKLTQRLNHGLTYAVAFTWSKALDDGSGDRDGILYPSNTYQLFKERGPSTFNEPHRFSANFVYDLPLGPGRAYLNHGIGAAIIGGWQAGGIFTAHSGVPVSPPEITDGQGPNLGNPNTEYGNFTGISPVPTNRTLQHWWNGAAFDNTNPDLAYQPGNAGRNPMTGIGAVDFDASLARFFTIKENHRLNVRLDAFNSTNHPNYSTPSTNYLSPTTFGIVTAAGTMRQLQLSAKYSF